MDHTSLPSVCALAACAPQDGRGHAIALSLHTLHTSAPHQCAGVCNAHKPQHVLFHTSSLRHDSTASCCLTPNKAVLAHIAAAFVWQYSPSEYVFLPTPSLGQQSFSFSLFARLAGNVCCQWPSSPTPCIRFERHPQARAEWHGKDVKPACMHVCVYACKYACMYVCVCMCVCMLVCM